MPEDVFQDVFLFFPMHSPVFSFMFSSVFPSFYPIIFPVSPVFPSFAMFSPVFSCFPNMFSSVFLCFSCFPLFCCFPKFFSVFACFPVFCHLFYVERDFKKIITLEDNIGQVGQKGNRPIRLRTENCWNKVCTQNNEKPWFLSFFSFLSFFFFCSKLVGGLIENTARK